MEWSEVVVAVSGEWGGCGWCVEEGGTRTESDAVSGWVGVGRWWVVVDRDA